MFYFRMWSAFGAIERFGGHESYKAHGLARFIENPTQAITMAEYFLQHGVSFNLINDQAKYESFVALSRDLKKPIVFLDHQDYVIKRFIDPSHKCSFEDCPIFIGLTPREQLMIYKVKPFPNFAY